MSLKHVGYQVPRPTHSWAQSGEWEKGQLCPSCESGRLYKFEPATFIRIVGQAPLAAQKHILEQLRCNRCGALFTAPLPEAVSQDGARGQKYAYSARTVMALHKFSAGSPYYRQEGLQSLLGVPVTASTIYDQCALLADDLRPIWLIMIVIAANAVHFHLDDTGHKILDQKTPIEKAKRNGKGTRLRSGVYTSGVIATLDSGEDLVLFKTNIGHAGEWIDEILTHRDPQLSLPLIMCDALSSNRPTVTAHQLSLCNAHSRRGFTDVATNFPQQVQYVVKQYAQIWLNDTEAKRQQLNAQQRLSYHQTHSLPVMESIKTWAEQQRESPQWQEHSGLARAVAYLLKHYTELTAFCRIAGAKLDNNYMEMVLRLIVLNRKNAYFYRTQAGAEVGDIFTSLIATCELNGVNPFDYFNAVQRNRLAVSRHPQQWLPGNYRGTLAKVSTVAA
ncbi:MAG: IS66 family transposase [Exilibacterium sp.]